MLLEPFEMVEVLRDYLKTGLFHVVLREVYAGNFFYSEECFNLLRARVLNAIITQRYCPQASHFYDSIQELPETDLVEALRVELNVHWP